jgi:putrescine aminotransferase
MKPGKEIIAFDRAMKLSRNESTELFGRYVNHPLASLLKLANGDMRFSRAEGVYLYDERERPYMDLTAGYGALNLGHNPKEVIEAVHEAQKLPAVLLVGFNPLMGALGKTLAAILPGDLSVAVFGSGGAEAVENAMKTARAGTGRHKFVSCLNGYHGLSFGALSVCGSERFRMTVAPLLNLPELAALVPVSKPGANTSLLCLPNGWQVGSTSAATMVEVSPRPPSPAQASGTSSIVALRLLMFTR